MDEGLLESKPAALDLRVEVVVDETKQCVDLKNDAVRRRDVGASDACLHTVVTHIHCTHHRQTNQPSCNAAPPNTSFTGVYGVALLVGHRTCDSYDS